MANSIYSGQPEFVSTSIESPMGRFALQLITDRGDVTHAVGTAALIGPGVALTAGHVLDVCDRAYGVTTTSRKFRMVALQYGSAAEFHAFEVRKVFRAPFTDLALLHLVGDPTWLPSHYPRLNLKMPTRGEKIFAFGYPGKAASTSPTEIHVVSNGHTATGQVLDVFDTRRDAVLAPFPCFSTNARFDDAMSGGPVFDQQGTLRGLVCSNMPPEPPAVDHHSLVTLLWPMAAMELDIPWKERPAESYRMYDYLAACGHRVLGLDRIIVRAGEVSYRSKG